MNKYRNVVHPTHLMSEPAAMSRVFNGKKTLGGYKEIVCRKCGYRQLVTGNHKKTDEELTLPCRA